MKLSRNLIGTTAAVLAAAGLGSAVTKPEGDWYRSLTLPSWQPPGIAFPLVWSPLYASIAKASAVALDRFEARGDDAQAAGLRRALGINLALNAGWSVVFFGLERPWGAVPVAAGLALSSADLARRAGRAGAGPGVALAPYAAWTAFALVLNMAVARANQA